MMMHPGNLLDLPGELHARSVSRGGSFEIFRSAELGEYLSFDPPLFYSISYPACAVRISLQTDVVMFVSAQFPRQFTLMWALALSEWLNPVNHLKHYACYVSYHKTKYYNLINIL